MKEKTSIGLLIIAFIAFISLGLPDGLHGVAWPGVRTHFRVPIDAIGLVLIFATAGYMASSFFSGVLVRRLGIGGLLSASCAATATALCVYAVTPVWRLFVLIAGLGGLGAGAIDAGINTFVAQHYSGRTMQWLHACFGIGITLGPAIMTLGIAITNHWQVGYVVVCIFQGVLAIIFYMTRNIWKKVPVIQQEDHTQKADAPMAQTLKKFSAWVSMLLFFIYTGVELGFGLWIYTLLTESRNIAPAVAGIVTGSYWGMFTIGRIMAGWYTKKITGEKLINISIVCAAAGTGLVLVNRSDIATIVGIVVIGFSVAPIFPALVSDTKTRVDSSHEANTIGMQLAAAGFGAAVIPSLAGLLARLYGLEVIPLYMLCALVLLFASFFLSRFPARSE
jgi:fucose permease